MEFVIQTTSTLKKLCLLFLPSLLFFLLSSLSTLHAQDAGLKPIHIPDIQQSTPQELAALPANVRQVREAQLRLARENNVVIETIDTPAKSRTLIHEVPYFLATQTISNEDEATALIQNLYPYYGFGSTESLQLESESKGALESIYRFRQYIDGIRTPHRVSALVDEETGQVKQLLGSTVLDLDYSRTPRLSEEEAIEAALELANEKEAENVAAGGGLIYRLDGGDIYTEIEEYMPWGDGGILEPVWTVYIPLLEQSDPSFTHEPFRVNPDGVAVDPIPTLNSARTCDGSQPTSNQSPYCTDPGRPLVVYANGTCAPGYDCEGAQEFHKRAWDTKEPGKRQEK